MAKGENIFKRKDGRWEARYIRSREEDGRIKYGFCYGKTYVEAKARVTEAKAKLLNEANLDSVLNKEKFSSYCDCWLDLRSTQLKTSSYVKYQNGIEKHVKPYLGELYLKDITTEKISAFSQHLLNEKKLSIKSVRDILTFVRSILSYINRQIDGELSHVEVIYPRESPKAIRVLTEQEESELILYLAEGMNAGKFAVYLALRTGMRIGEICALRWKDISFADETIHVGNTVQRIKNIGAQGDSKTVLMIGSPKSDKSRRTIPLMPDIAALCRKFYRGNPECFVLTGKESCMEPRKLQRYLKSYTKECDIQDIHFHTLRHTFATRCVEVGFDVKTLSEVLGHASISVTLERYVHPNLNLKRENMRRLKIVDCFSSEQSDTAVNQ
jgi:Site-specific recombinase XerD